MSDVILIERDGPLATVVLNRPEKLNALDKSMWQGVGDAFTALDADDGVRCVVLRGAGDKALGPGADIKEANNPGVMTSSAGPWSSRIARSGGGCCLGPRR